MIEIRPAKVSDLSSDSHPMLLRGIKAGAEVASDESGPICFWGFDADTILGPWAFVWMHPVRDLGPYARRFLRANRRYIDSLLARYPILYGTVDSADPVALRWMKWLGFSVDGEIEISGRVYIRMELHRGS